MDGTNLVNETDVIEAVRQSAMLADVTISTWSAERTDKEAMEKIKQDAGASGNVGRVVKNMLAGADTKLKEVRSAFMACRALHYSMTLPWVSDPHATRQTGPRLLPHLLFQKYIAEMAVKQRAAYIELDKFIADYPVYVTQARSNLGSLADLVYPGQDEVRAQFRFSFDFEPLPAEISFKGLPDHTIERLSVMLRDKQQRMIAQATAQMWKEARERVAHIVDRLSDPNAVFKAATIENTRELLTLLPGWNMTGDQAANEIVGDIKTMLDGLDVKSLREDPRIRSDVTNKARAIIGKLDSWGL